MSLVRGVEKTHAVNLALAHSPCNPSPTRLVLIMCSSLPAFTAADATVHFGPLLRPVYIIGFADVELTGSPSINEGTVPIIY